MIKIILLLLLPLTIIASDKTITIEKNDSLEIIKKGWNGNTAFDGIFANYDTLDTQLPFTQLLKWWWSDNPQKEEKENDHFTLNVKKQENFRDIKGNYLSWIGHATVLIKLGNKTIITDPVFGDIPMYDRLAEMPCDTDSLQDIDYLLTSHGHRDHFDEISIETVIENNPKIIALSPLKFSNLFDSDFTRIQEAAWFQKYKTDEVEIYLMPAKHWHKRGPLDYNDVLWGSYIIKYKDTVIYFAGDTAYGPHFKEIATYFDIDIALIPIGAYQPSFIMKNSHLNPDEAIQAFKDLKAKVMIPIHYATFDLADEPIGEPYRRVKKYASEQPEKFNFLQPGKILSLDSLHKHFSP